MNVDDRTNTLIISDVPFGIDAVTDLINILDVAEQQVEIEARIIEASTNFSRDLGVQLGIGIGRIEPARNAFGDVADRVTSQINTGTPAGGTITGVGGLVVGGLVDTFRLDAIITAGEVEGEARILSKPRVTAQNNAEATITQGSDIPVPVTQNFTTTVQFQTAALRLTVTPRVTNVGTILLDIQVENNIPDFARTVLGIPAIQTSESQTQVLVADGGTTVIGGIYVQQESDSENRVPGLGQIPLVGNLFKTTSKSKDTREIIFFITARIQG